MDHDTIEMLEEQVATLEADRDSLRAALERIDELDVDWTIGTDANLLRAKTIARQVLTSSEKEKADG